jgi:hypothetical protein
MYLGITAFGWLHTILSLIALVAGVVVVNNLLKSRIAGGWVALFLLAAIATSVSGFGFPFDRLIDSHWVGIVALATLALVLVAYYAFGLAGVWRWIFALGVVVNLYFLFVVLVVMFFRKVPALAATAPTQSEPSFLAAQLAVLAVFAVIAIIAVRKFRPAVA